MNQDPLNQKADEALTVVNPANLEAALPAVETEAVTAAEPKFLGIDLDIWIMIILNMHPTDLWKFATLCQATALMLTSQKFKRSWFNKWTTLMAFTKAEDPLHSIETGNFNYYADFWKRLSQEFFKAGTIESKSKCLKAFGPEVLRLNNMLSHKTITLDVPADPLPVAAPNPADPNAPDPTKIHLTPMTVVLAAGHMGLFLQLQRQHRQLTLDNLLGDETFTNEEERRTALKVINEQAHLNFAAYFFQNAQVTVNPLTALHIFGQSAAILYCLKNFYNAITPDAKCRMTGDRTLLEDACSMGNTELATLLMNHPAIQFECEVNPAVRAFDGGHISLCADVLRAPNFQIEVSSQMYLLRKILESKNWDLLTTLLQAIFSGERTDAFDTILSECMKNNELGAIRELVTRCPKPWVLRDTHIRSTNEPPQAGKLPVELTNWLERACKLNNKLVCQMILDIAPVVVEGDADCTTQEDELIGKKLDFLMSSELETALTHYVEGRCKFFPDFFKNPNQGLVTAELAGRLVRIASSQGFIQTLLDNPTFHRHAALEELLVHDFDDCVEDLLAHPLTEPNIVLASQKKSMVQVLCERSTDLFRIQKTTQLIKVLWKHHRDKLNAENIQRIIHWAYQFMCKEIIDSCDVELIRSTGVAEVMLRDADTRVLCHATSLEFPMPFAAETEPFALALQAKRDREPRLTYLMVSRNLTPPTRFKDGNSLLHVLINTTRGFGDLLKTVQERHPELRSVTNPAGQTALDLACATEYWEAVRILFDEQAIRAKLNTLSGDGISFAHKLIDAGFLETHPPLFLGGVLDPNYRDPQGRNYANILCEKAELPTAMIKDLMDRNPGLFNMPCGKNNFTAVMQLLSRITLPAELREHPLCVFDNIPESTQHPILVKCLGINKQIQACMSPKTKLPFTQFLKLKIQCSGELELFQRCVHSQLAKKTVTPFWRVMLQSCLQTFDPQTQQIKNVIIDKLLQYQKDRVGHHDRVDSLFIDVVKAESIEELRNVIAIQIRIHSGDESDCDLASGRHLVPMKRTYMHFRFWRLLKQLEARIEGLDQKPTLGRMRSMC